MRNLRAFLISLLLMAATVAVSFLWLDRPIAYFAHEQLAQYRIFDKMQRAPEYMVVIACFVFVLAGYYVLERRPLSRFLSVLLLSGISLCVTALIKDQLKFVFGRTWPETWTNNNPSLIRDGVSGFNFFHGGSGYAAFPSGHMALACAVMSVLWFSYTRCRVYFGAVVAMVAIGLIGANYHYLSDLIAGAFIGWTTGWIAVLLWDTGNLPRLRPGNSPSLPSA